MEAATADKMIDVPLGHKEAMGLAENGIRSDGGAPSDPVSGGLA